MKGLLKWDGKILTDNGWFSIRYLKGVATETKQFGMCTKGLLISGNEVNVSREQALEQFFSLITPIFNFLENNAKWKFAKIRMATLHSTARPPQNTVRIRM